MVKSGAPWRFRHRLAPMYFPFRGHHRGMITQNPLLRSEYCPSLTRNLGFCWRGLVMPLEMIVGGRYRFFPLFYAKQLDNATQSPFSRL